MKAIVYHNYGLPDVLKCEEVEKPTPKDDEVLIKVRAVSVNPLDSHLMKGKPRIARIFFGLRKPKITRPGVDVAGHVEAVGSKVTQFKPGDAVFGSCRGACAEYVCTAESALALKPDNMTFEQAAAVNVAGLTALQGIRNKAKVKAGQKVLINGAAGGVGTFTVQIAKAFGADVTGVCSTSNVDMVRSIGADHVIDYTQEDFTKGTERYDLIFDLVANHSVSACRRVLNPKGMYLGAGVLGAGTSVIRILNRFIAMFALSPFVSQKLSPLMARRSKEDLNTLREMMEAGKVTPVIDRRYSLSETPEAIRYMAAGHARGKVVITVD